MAAIEFAFWIFPATPMSSAVLQLAHAAILFRIRPPTPILLEAESVSTNNVKTKRI